MLVKQCHKSPINMDNFWGRLIIALPTLYIYIDDFPMCSNKTIHWGWPLLNFWTIPHLVFGGFPNYLRIVPAEIFPTIPENVGRFAHQKIPKKASFLIGWGVASYVWRQRAGFKHFAAWKKPPRVTKHHSLSIGWSSWLMMVVCRFRVLNSRLYFIYRE